MNGNKLRPQQPQPAAGKQSIEWGTIIGLAILAAVVIGIVATVVLTVD
jgi:hypothetical protein